MSELFDNLNDKQIEAVIATEGKVRVVAGAGSGKTRVLAHRYAYLVNEVGIDPGNILCMTFTNKAAREMKNRIAQLVHRAHANDFTCTIHGFCVKFLRREIHRLGYPKSFTILDEEDQKALAKQVMEEMHLDATNTTITQFLNGLAYYKNGLGYIPSIIVPNVQLEAKDINENVRYIQLQLKNFAIDYNDIINYALYIMDNYPDALAYWQDLLNYVQVDEVQDCNAKDWAIINHVSGGYGNLFIVGDPDQAIYEWRGAKPDMFIEFPTETDIILNQNYRSTPNILSVANSIIEHNENRIPKDLFTERPSDKVAIHYHGKSEEEKCKWIVDQISDLNNTGASFSDFAIMYRASYLSRNIEQALMKKQTKYVVWGGIRFFERREIKDCLAYLRLIANQKDDLAFSRIINVPKRSFGKSSLMRLQELADAEGLSLYETLVKHKDDEAFASKPAVMQFIQLIDDYHGYSSFTAIGELLDSVLKDTGLDNMYREEGDDERLQNIEELKSSVKEYETLNVDSDFLSLESYLQEIALYTNADYKEDGETVKLMTIHQAKGLEFPYVFIMGLTEGVFPCHRSIRERNKRAEEEERRLMYVAVTRAEKALFLTESEGYNYVTKQDKYPSRFILEIQDGLLDVKGNIDTDLLNNLLAGTKRQIEELEAETDPVEFEVGDKVAHKIFGGGEVIEKTNETSYRIRFEKGDRFLQAKHLKIWDGVTPPQDLFNKPECPGNRPEIVTVLHVGDIIHHNKYGRGVVEKVWIKQGLEKAFISFDGGESHCIVVNYNYGSFGILEYANKTKVDNSECVKGDKLMESYLNQFKIGDNVYHSNLGKGVVLSVDGEGADCLAKVEFEGSFVKKIHPIYLSPFNEGKAINPEKKQIDFLVVGDHIEHTLLGKGKVIKIEKEKKETVLAVDFEKIGKIELIMSKAKDKIKKLERED